MNARSNQRSFGFSTGALYRDAQSLLEALQDQHLGPPVVAHLPATFVADFTQQLALASQHETDQSGARGTAGALTQTQKTALADYVHLALVARRSAQLAFPAQDVQLHGEFQVGQLTTRDLPAVLNRARKLLTACRKYPDALASFGWSAAATTALSAAIDALAAANQDQKAAYDVKVGLTADRNSVARDLYRQCLAVQNAARIAYPKTKVPVTPGIVEAQARFLLATFPPRAGAKANASAAVPAAPAASVPLATVSPVAPATVPAAA